MRKSRNKDALFLLFFEKLKEVRVKDKNFQKKAQKLKRFCGILSTIIL